MHGDLYRRQLAQLGRLVDKRFGRQQPNALEDPQWRPLCSLVLSITEEWPVTHARAAAAIAYLEDQGYVPWRDPLGKRESADSVIFAALEDNVPARVALAAALVELHNSRA